MEGFEEFMAEMLEEYNYDKDAVMVTTAFSQALADEWGKQLLIHSVSQQRELLLQAYKDGFQAATDSIIGANEMVKNKNLQ